MYFKFATGNMYVYCPYTDLVSQQKLKDSYMIYIKTFPNKVDSIFPFQ